MIKTFNALGKTAEQTSEFVITEGIAEMIEATDFNHIKKVEVNTDTHQTTLYTDKGVYRILIQQIN